MGPNRTGRQTMTESPILSGCEVLSPMEPEPPRNCDRKGVIPKTSKKKAAGRFAVLNNFVDFSLHELTRACLAVWLILYRDTKDGTARTSQADIARRAGISVRAVRTAIRRLESLGLLTVVYLGGLNRGVSRYRVAPLTKGSLRNRASA